MTRHRQSSDRLFYLLRAGASRRPRIWYGWGIDVTATQIQSQ